MPDAVLTFAFDPVARIGDGITVRIEVLVLAFVLFAGLILAARIRRVSMDDVRSLTGGPRGDAELLVIVLGAIPGAVVGARLGDVLDHLAFYRANPGLLLDVTQGGFGLTLAVPLGILTAGITGWLLAAPVARWMHAAALPLLFVLVAGKLAGLIGGAGQGLPSDLPWATAYAGPGPWDSLAPAVPSQPSAAYEAILLIVALGLLIAAQRLEVVARRDGAALFVAVGLWAAVRFGVAFSWRDPIELGPLRVDQVLSFLVLGLSIVGFAERARARGRETG